MLTCKYLVVSTVSFSIEKLIFKNEEKMEKIINVSTGEVKAAKADAILKSTAIGSCVVIAAYYTKEIVGALAHIMLPGASGQ